MGDAQGDEVPQRGAGYGPRDYAGEADVSCKEGWIRVPNVCADEADAEGDGFTLNTLDHELKGYWNLEGNTQDASPHCKDSRGSGKQNLGSCNDGAFHGEENYIDGEPSQGLYFDGETTFIEVHDDDNPNWSNRRRDENELDLDTNSLTASVMAYLEPDAADWDGYLFAR